MPKLESMRIRGFKSFGRQTSIKFAEGITAVVGPNGSGKSNVIDALGFVMGSLSFSQLRAKRASEFLFSGSKRSASEAVVELKIKDENNKVSDDGIVKIERKLLKDGSSVYRLNGKRTTRLAVLDALAALNIFPDAHNILHQGDVDKFLKITPEGRRKLIETVAEIDIYEKKKEKAVRNLEEVERRLENVKAVYNERIKIYERLKREKEKADRYFELKKMERRARKGILINRLNSLSRSIKELEEKKRKLTSKREKLLQEISRMESSKKEVEKVLQETGINEKIKLEKEIERKKFELKKAEDELLKLFSDIEAGRNRIERLSKEKEGLVKRKGQIESDLEKRKAEISELESKIKEIKEKRDRLIEKTSKEKQEYEIKKKEAERNRKMRDDLLRSLRDREAQLKFQEEMIKNLEKELKEIEEKKLRIEAEHKKYLESRKKAEKEIQKIEDEIKKAEEKMNELRKYESKLSISKIPQISSILLSRGFKLLGSQLNGEELKKAAPFAMWPVASEKELEELKKEIEREGGWGIAIPEKNVRKVLDAKGFVVFGNPEKAEFLESERTQKLAEVRQKMKEIQKRMAELHRRRSELNATLEQKSDYGERMKEIETRKREIKREMRDRKSEIVNIRAEIEDVEKKLKSVKIEEIEPPDLSEIDRLTGDLNRLENERMKLISSSEISKETLAKLILPEMKKIARIIEKSEEEIEKAKEQIGRMQQAVKEIKAQIESLTQNKQKIDEKLSSNINEKTKIEKTLAELNSEMIEVEKKITEAENRAESIEGKLKEVSESLEAYRDVEPVQNPEEVLNRVAQEISQMGAINFRAREDFKEISGMMEEINEKISKLEKEKQAVLEMMEKIETKKRGAFLTAFNEINRNFERIFKNLIGGEGKMELENPRDIFEGGVVIRVRLEGKERTINALSGGQKALTTLAFIVAIQKYKPSPFYVFDEVDAPLDKANSQVFVKILKEMSKDSQVIIVTHNDSVVRGSDQIIGVYRQRGESRIISLPKERVLSESEKWMKV